jgi:hypothetical protein
LTPEEEYVRSILDLEEIEDFQKLWTEHIKSLNEEEQKELCDLIDKLYDNLCDN